MNSTSRIFRVAIATLATAAVAALAAAPAQASEDRRTFERNSSGRSLVKSSPRVGASTEEVNTFRVGGRNRIETAVLASQFAWADAGSEPGPAAGAVVLSRADDYADALGGAALAGAASAPLLMTPTATLHPDVKTEIDRVLGGSGTVYVLGGTGAVSGEVAAQLSAAGYTVERLAGATRFETSVRVAEKTGALAPDGIPQFVFATTGLDFPDGLAAGATAGGYWASVVLTKGSEVTPQVGTYLEAMRAKGAPLYAVGGAAAGSQGWSWDADFSGANRFETAAMVAHDFWADASTTDDNPVAIGLATGLDWPDALAGGAFMAGWGPLMLSMPDALPKPTAFVTQAIKADPTAAQYGFVFGGEGVVGATPMQDFAALIG